MCIYIYIIWANYNDLTATSLEPWLVREIFPKWPYFRLVKYYNLPRYYRHISARFVNFPGELTTLQGLTMARCLQDFVPGCPGETTCSGRIGTPGWQAPSRCGMVSFVAQFFGDPNKVLDRKKKSRECFFPNTETLQSYFILSRYDII